MAQHPPWLRFQAYVVGLPKTGSTSLTTVFSNYRTAHEWQLMDLIGAALSRQNGTLDDDGFLQAVSGRLDPPSVEMDSATSHHLYAEVLRDRFPHAVFVHTVRDVLSWTNSLLDMTMRKQLARRLVHLPYSVWEQEYLAQVTEGTYDLFAEDDAPETATLPALLRYWTRHMHRMAAVLPAARSIRVRTRDIGDQLPALAQLTGVPVASLRADRAHTNRSPHTFDRFAAFASDEVHAVYEAECAPLMADLFPEEHAAWQAGRIDPQRAADWPAYLANVRVWVAEAVRAGGARAAH